MATNKKQNFLNLISNLLALVIQFSINFFVVPKIIADLGTEAIGYVNLSTDFVSYFTVFSVIFNSVAGRFIAIEINRDNISKANEYLNSVILANSILSICIAFAGIIFIPNIDSFIKISPEYVFDVKITFLITWTTFLINIMSSVFTIGTYVKNKLDANAIRNIISYILRVIVIVVLFTLLPIKVYFLSAATLVSTTFLGFANYSLTKKFLPEIKVNIKLARKKSVKEIASSGIWMSFTSLSGIMMRGLDNLLANLFFDQVAMGNLSTSRTIPNAVTTVIGTLGPLFTPTFVSLYSKNKAKDLIEEAKNSIRINGLIMIVPVSGFIAFAKPFYNLWLYGNDKETISLIILLSSITVIQAYFNSATASIAQLSVVTNKLKLPVLVSFGMGILNVFSVFLLAKYTDLGVVALSLSSTVIMSLRYIFFNSWYAAKVLNTNSKQFYKTLFRTLLPAPIMLVVFFLISSNLQIGSWLKLIVICGLCGIAGYIFSAFIILPRKEIKALVNKVKSKIIK